MAPELTRNAEVFQEEPRTCLMPVPASLQRGFVVIEWATAQPTRILSLLQNMTFAVDQKDCTATYKPFSENMEIGEW
ncbi:hypothetical protein NPIL_114991 [Nephila pilipes]|uniref:Uncharacterized protein n=1 Tax=Nephila pilipes TaxID=299642 RepID=A0A8X6UBT7_NEPPI|nr:hypothetical protein NPIL_114991 [Nephila pilipes]